ncbi:MAG: zinc-dependent alcohol dehydrogenase family protein [Firmicutes bacterium]|jgi:L-iditol 2-dehydrogenase|nr:zinc-dependent alcohol dehydrogenase family protein [Bacillota bacterium]
MKAALFLGKGRIETAVLDDIEPRGFEVKVRNKAAGICGTDIHIYHGEKGSADVKPPVVLGHEYTGEVVAVGASVTTVKVGDKVAIDPNIYCQTCYYCRSGRKQHCENLTAIGVNRNGGFAEYSVVPEKQVYRLADTVDYETGAMTEPLACCLHGIDLAQIRPGDTVCVIGGGAIGQLMVQLAKLSGAARIILSEPVAQRRQIALENGADFVIDPFAEDVGQAVRRTNSRGADVVIECAGNLKATQQAFDAAGKGAAIVLFSVPKPDAQFPLKLFDVFQKELKIVGSFINPDTHQRAVNLINEGKVNTKPLITHRYGLDELEDAIRKQSDPDSIKVMVKP